MTGNDVIETTLRVRYSETDAMGVVYHTNFIIWFEVGRGEYMRQKGGSYHESFEAKGFFLPVTEVKARFLAPARYGDLVTVRTSVAELRSRSMTFAYEVLMKETGQVLATGHTKHICVDGEGQITRIPQEVRELLSR
ncbi:MAG: acyl-CoA thioesterase [Anaerolineae bacterium]